MPRKHPTPAEPQLAGTIPQAARRFGVGVNHLRHVAKTGAFPIYDAETRRPRVFFADVEQWLRSTRVRPTRQDRFAVFDRPDDKGKS